MGNLSSILEKVNHALEEPINEFEITQAMLLLGNKLAEPKWAIEDEKLRDEYEKLMVQMVVRNYMSGRSNKSLDTVMTMA